jgi:hypothetical protein
MDFDGFGFDVVYPHFRHARRRVARELRFPVVGEARVGDFDDDERVPGVREAAGRDTFHEHEVGLRLAVLVHDEGILNAHLVAVAVPRPSVFREPSEHPVQLLHIPYMSPSWRTHLDDLPVNKLHSTFLAEDAGLAHHAELFDGEAVFFDGLCSFDGFHLTPPRMWLDVIVAAPRPGLT